MNRPKGTKDIYGKEQAIRSYIFDILKSVSQVYNFKKIETPIFESKEVFVRSVGETSDIVTKEMYVFKDKGDREMVLRPEGTAGTIRAIVENKLYTKLPLKVFYEGPMFRYENPQKGRQRQFTQFGVEMIGERNPFADIEVILMASLILKELKIPYLLKINSLGDKETRVNYSKALREYFRPFESELTQDSINRLDKNPLRILDDKVDSQKDFVKNAPRINAYYSEEIKTYFDTVISYLKESDVNFEIDTTLVRGLDYYTDTAFEFVSISGEAGSQSTLIGGGRYQNLVKEFGGPDLSGIGFGLGVERLMNELANIEEEEITEAPHIFVLNIADTKQKETMKLVEMFRANGFITEWNPKATKLIKAFDKADESGAHVLVIAGEKELANGEVTIKMHGKQHTVKIADAVETIDAHLASHEGGHHEEH